METRRFYQRVGSRPFWITTHGDQNSVPADEALSSVAAIVFLCFQVELPTKVFVTWCAPALFFTHFQKVFMSVSMYIFNHINL